MFGIKNRAVRFVCVAAVAATSSIGGPLLSAAALPSTLAGATPLPSIQTKVMGAPVLNAAQLAAWYHTKHSGAANLPNLANNIQTLAQIYLDEGAIDGVRGDIAFVQSYFETGVFMFPSGGQIRADFNNFSGLFAFNGRTKGTTCAAETTPSRCFATPTLGVRYQIQLLRGYADITVANDPTRLIKPPADRRGLAPYWEQFGGQSGKAIWATAPNYGVIILTSYNGALAYNGVNLNCLPYYQGASTGTSGTGYWLFGTDGVVYPFGSAANYGDLRSLNLWKPVVSAEATPDKKGYWMLGLDGGVFAFGNAHFYGSLGGVKLWSPVNDFATTPDGKGYWLSAGDGGIFAFGSAHFYGSLGGVKLTAPVTSIEATPSGKGYWLTQSDGVLWPFGDAGNFSHIHRTRGIVEVKRSKTGNGYYQLRNDGGIARFGDAVSYGNQMACGMTPASHMALTPTGNGYWIVSTSGSVLAFGDAKALGMPATTTGGVAGFAVA